VRCLLPVLLVLLGLALCASAAPAAEFAPEARHRAENAFLQGRLRDLDRILKGAASPLDRFPLWLRDTYWRSGPRKTPLQEGDRALFQASLAWIREPEGPHPLGHGGGDPYPILTALVRDRLRREHRGGLGLPEESPLVVLALRLDPQTEKDETFFLGERSRALMGPVYKGVVPDAADRKLEAESRRLRGRNERWALISLGLFLLLALVLAREVTRRRPAAPGSASLPFSLRPGP